MHFRGILILIQLSGKGENVRDGLRLGNESCPHPRAKNCLKSALVA